MVAAKAEGKAKIAAKLQMRPMPIQRVVCEFLLTDCYDDDGDDDDGNDADDDVEEEQEVGEKWEPRGQRGHDRPVSLQGHCQQSEHRGVDLWINAGVEQLTWISLCWLTVTQLVNMLILQKIEPKIQWPSLIVMNLGK